MRFQLPPIIEKKKSVGVGDNEYITSDEYDKGVYFVVLLLLC